MVNMFHKKLKKKIKKQTILWCSFKKLLKLHDSFNKFFLKRKKKIYVYLPKIYLFQLKNTLLFTEQTKQTLINLNQQLTNFFLETLKFTFNTKH